MTTATPPCIAPLASAEPQPAWEIATLFPPQGHWREADFDELAARTNRIIELVHGRIEFPPMPTMMHQWIAHFFCNLLMNLKAGFAVPAAFKLRLGQDHIREPDVVFMLLEHAEHVANKRWEKADLVLEVVSSDNPERDYIEKRADYAAAGITEYWIVDPQKQTVIVLELTGDHYAEHGPFAAGQTATSILLPGLAVSVDALFEAGTLEFQVKH